ncbi:predicted protein [Histoplasma mississippiense (nom. inval.)]|uniref:predicted protein n=1 Tax=Ajellomyces capsulatus (strain NAm1 / WU24) TaxID=2059318 RepID=UPI000157D05B|nr:predicted protein [Histoplasma mississippiense (nom. inval.)]EDN11234.1 predicted protein [Histoplasma mississippiense (nom. inval.)]
MQYTVPMPAEGHTGCECDQWDQKDFCLPSAQESKVNKMSLVLGAAALLENKEYNTTKFQNCRSRPVDRSCSITGNNWNSGILGLLHFDVFERYNTLLDDSNQPPVADAYITDLAEIFIRHNVEKVFGIHLIHGHFKIPKGTVMLGTNFESPSLQWTKVTDIDKIDPSRVHGHIFALAEDDLCACELQGGRPLPDLSGIGPEVLDGFINYIVKNNLTSLIGLQVLGWSDSSMSELILDHGAVMLGSTYVKNIKNTAPTLITGWKFEMTGAHPDHACYMLHFHHPE